MNFIKNILATAVILMTAGICASDPVIDLSSFSRVLVPPSSYSNCPVTRQELNEGLESVANKTLYGNNSPHPVMTGKGSLVNNSPTVSVITNVLSDGTNYIGTFWYTNSTTMIRAGKYTGRFFAKKTIGTKTSSGFMRFIYTGNNGLTTNVIDTSAQVGSIMTTLGSYRLLCDNDNMVEGTNLYLGVDFYYVQSEIGQNCTIETYLGEPYDTHLETPGVGNINGYVTPADLATKVSKSGDTMTGPLTNSVAYWLPANGRVYFGTSTNYIEDQGGTNFLFKAGEKWANFDW